MHLYGGTVSDVAAAFNRAPAAFVEQCAQDFHARFRQPVGEAERSSWTRSWPRLFDMLLKAGLGQLWMALEYELPGSGERIDALLLGRGAHGVLSAIVVELKQWTEANPVHGDALRYNVRGRVAMHPCYQAAGYVRYLQQWIDRSKIKLEVRGVAVVHDAPTALVHQLSTAVAGMPGSGQVPVLGREDLAGMSAAEWATRIGCESLNAPTPVQVEEFLRTRHVPALSLFENLEAVLNGNADFTLVGEQQRAQLELLRQFETALRDRDAQHVIAVTGGPGTGKTFIAARLLAAVPQRAHQLGTACTARYLTPSGTLRWQLERAAKDPAAKGLFGNLTQSLGRLSAQSQVVIVDEAQRIRAAAQIIPQILKRTHVSTFFLDERQIIRPFEGITVTQLAKAAADAGAEFTRVDLVSQFRCGGSQRYLTWLDEVFSPAAAGPSSWDCDDYDVAVAQDPAQLQAWVDEHTASDTVARIVAGFCWPWNREQGQPLLDEVTISWTDTTGQARTWQRPWNSRHALVDDEGMPIAPRAEYWATDPGGHNQIGCIYTAQGLEYPYNAVILGPDLVRRGNQWIARPECSEDSVMQGVAADDYRQLAFNIYRVLLTRGSRGCRLYSADPETQAFLRRLLPSHG